jgi:alkylation response protein AidB-like acyl-CoA dehydrogenase
MDQSLPLADPLARARALQPLLREAAPRIEAARELTQDVLAALHAAALFRLVLPRELGGAEAPLAVFADVIEAIAEADASTAWCLGQGAGCAMSAAYLAPEAARAVFGAPTAALAWGAGANGKAVPAEGGWRVTGRWMFASGSRHCEWLGGHCGIVSDQGKPEVRTFLFPKAAAKITDTWYVLGLRGTGSDSYAVEDVFVPAAFSLDRSQPAAHPSPLYHMPLFFLYPAAFGAVALGIARAVLGSFIALAADKTPRGASARLRENAAVQHLVGHMTARLQAARAYHWQTLAELWRRLEAGETLRDVDGLGIRTSSTYAIHESVAVVECAFHEAGASAIFDANPFERRFRDLHAVAQQMQGRRSNFELVGQHLLGMTEGPLFV